jgi:hypothetical protein
MRDEFSVYQFFDNDTYERVRDHVSIEEAMEAAKHHCTSVGAKIGLVSRVIITDGGDCICFEWRRGAGVIFPPQGGDNGRHKS